MLFVAKNNPWFAKNNPLFARNYPWFANRVTRQCKKALKSVLFEVPKCFFIFYGTNAESSAFSVLF